MKKAFVFAVLCLALSWVYAQSAAPLSDVEISFAFTRQSGFSSNQFAVWIEDNSGSLVRTLFAAKFTAAGGWAKRPQSIPLWVQKSGLAALGKKDVDAFSGATPRSGALNYRWDGLDKNGNPATPGEYRVFLEATLRDSNRVLYSAPFTLGDRASGPVEAEVRAVYFGDSAKERGMIDSVRVAY